MSGFSERVVGDWLTNSDERSYQLAFAAYLSRLGEVVKYVSAHTQLEHGKDIVSVDPDGLIHAYQLKAGDISMRNWREMAEEVREAASVPVSVPGLPVRCADRVHLVLSGRLSDPVRSQIELINHDQVARQYAPIATIEFDELVAGFVKVFEEFFPGAIGPLQELLKLYLTEGTGPQDKPALAHLQQRLGPATAGAVAIRRSFTNQVVAADFASAPFRRAKNHISIIDTWVLTACRIILDSRRLGLSPNRRRPSLSLCKLAIESASADLLEEVSERPDLVEGDILLDTLFLPYRRLIVLGYVGAAINSRYIERKDVRDYSWNLTQLVLRERPLGIWGEGSWNYYLNICTGMAHSPQGYNVAEQMGLEWITNVCTAAPPMKDPYWTVVDDLNLTPQDDSTERERRKISYSLLPAFHMIVRRMRRQALAALWFLISRYELAAVIPDSIDDELLWSVEEGCVELRELPITGSWQALSTEAREQRSSLFDKEDSWLLPYFLCSYSHRVTPALSGELDFLARPGMA